MQIFQFTFLFFVLFALYLLEQSLLPCRNFLKKMTESRAECMSSREHLEFLLLLKHHMMK